MAKRLQPIQPIVTRQIWANDATQSHPLHQGRFGTTAKFISDIAANAAERMASLDSLPVNYRAVVYTHGQLSVVADMYRQGKTAAQINHFLANAHHKAICIHQETRELSIEDLDL